LQSPDERTAPRRAGTKPRTAWATRCACGGSCDSRGNRPEHLIASAPCTRTPATGKLRRSRAGRPDGCSSSSVPPEPTGRHGTTNSRRCVLRPNYASANGPVREAEPGWHGCRVRPRRGRTRHPSLRGGSLLYVGSTSAAAVASLTARDRPITRLAGTSWPPAATMDHPILLLNGWERVGFRLGSMYPHRPQLHPDGTVAVWVKTRG